MVELQHCSWAVILPKLGKYTLVREQKIDELDRWEINVFYKQKLP
jgi:hypothetical protein